MDKIELLPGWKVVKLGQYCHKPEYGYTASATEENGGYKFLRITDIQNGNVKWENVPYCEIDTNKIDKYILMPGDIVVARIGATTGKSFLIDVCPPSLFASYLIRIRTKSEILPSFLNLYFETSTYWQQINANKGGKLKGGVNIPIIQNLLIPLPPLPEQKSIAHTLRTIQKAKETRQRELELERERKAALMEYLFTHGTRNEARKQTEIGEIPESWEVVKLGKIACIDMGQSPSGDTYNNTGVGKPLLNGPAEFGLEYPTPVQWTNKPTKICQIGDILFCVRGNTTGKMNIADQEYCIGRGIAAIRGEKSYSNTLFIKYLLQYNISQIYRIALSGGSTFPNIGSRQLKDYPVMYINQAEQKEIAHILKSCDTKIQALEKEISLTDELFHATLEELMTGKLSTKNLIAQ